MKMMKRSIAIIIWVCFLHSFGGGGGGNGGCGTNNSMVMAALNYEIQRSTPTTTDHHVMDLNIHGSSPWIACGCKDCLSGVWNTDAGGFSCGNRITHLMKVSDFAASKACRTVGGSEFPIECGSCNPDTCQRMAELATITTATTTTNEEDEDVPVTDEATSSNTDQQYRCGCNLCEKYGWQVYADGHTCGARIDYLLSNLGNQYPTEEDACRQVGVNEFPRECGLCNPYHCDSTKPPPPPPIQNHEPPKELYCFPPSAERIRFKNVWQKFTLEVKESPNDDDVCGPNDNLFITNAVSVSRNNNNNNNLHTTTTNNAATSAAVARSSSSSSSDELTLELGRRKSDGRWYGSEVRVLLPVGEHYDYGRYIFSIKSIQVIDTQTDDNQVIRTTLPPSIVLGLFTWDDTKNFAIKEDYNQEVDIELSRWGIRDNEDVQFLVQPPGNPQMFRFYSGGPPTFSLPVYDQAPHTYEFDWEPAEISWSSTAGGGGGGGGGEGMQTFTYSTKDALEARQPDYTQCMPANVEVRMNLWNLFGADGTPMDMEDSHVVRVVIDKFEYIPSGRTAVPKLGVCSKDCHCGEFQCLENRCSTVPSNGSNGDRNNNIAAATNDDEETNETAASTFWRNNRWVILGAFVGLVVLLAIVNFLYFYRKRYHGGPSIVEFCSVDKSIEKTQQEEYELDEVESYISGLSENDPYRRAIREAGNRPFSTEITMVPVIENSSNVAVRGGGVPTVNEEPLKIVSFNDEVELMPTPVADSTSSDVSLNRLPAGNGKGHIEFFPFGDCMNRLREEAQVSRITCPVPPGDMS